MRTWELLEVHIHLISILILIFFLLVSDVSIDHVYIETCSTDKVANWPEGLIGSSNRSIRIFVMESYGGLTLESSDNSWDSERRWNLQLKVDMIRHEVTFKFFDLQFSQEIIENVSELFFVFSVDDSFTKLWTNNDVIGTIPTNMRSMGIFLVWWVHVLKKGYDVPSSVFLQSLEYHNLFSVQLLLW